jgi:hypothetical protein
MALVVVAAALLAVAAVVMLISAPVGPVKVELPERTSGAVVEEDNRGAFLDGGLGDADGIPPLAGKTSVSTAPSGIAETRARAAGSAGGAKQPTRGLQRVTESRDGGTSPVITLPGLETHATENSAPSRDREGAPASGGGSLGRRPARHHVRRFGRTDEGAGHRQSKRRLEYTKDGSPILW